MSTRTLSILLSVSVFLLCSQVQAEEDRYYRYTATNGVIVIDEFLPAEYSASAYDIINKDGVVFEHIARELTSSEVLVQERKMAQEQLRQLKIREQRNTDRLLLSTFSSIGDIEHTRDRIIKQLDNKVETLRQNRIEQQRLLSNTYDDAANMERSLGKISAPVRNNIEIHKKKISELSELIDDAAAVVAETRNEYQIKIDRYGRLTNVKPEPVKSTPAAKPAMPKTN